MKSVKYNVLLIACLYISLLLFGAFNCSSSLAHKEQLGEVINEITKKDAIEVKDTFQVLLDVYSGLLKSKDSIKSKLSVQKDAIKKLLSNSTNDDSLVMALRNQAEIIESLLPAFRQYDSLLLKQLNKIQEEAKVQVGSRKIKLNGIDYFLFIADLDSHYIRTHYVQKDKNGGHSIATVLNNLMNMKLPALMVTNAGMFTPSIEPEGLYIEEGAATKFELDTGANNVDKNFYLKPNGVFYIDGKGEPHIVLTEKMADVLKDNKAKIKCATQSGPMLVIDGKIHEGFSIGSNNMKIRSGVGIIDKKKVIFALTIDSENFYRFSTFFKDIFSCKDALFLDGAISEMYLHDLNPRPGTSTFGPMISVTYKSK